MTPATRAPHPTRRPALLVVDVQIDFCPGGALGVPNGDTIIPRINEYVHDFHARQYPVIASRDWHPPHHSSFKAQGGPWPVHCVQMSRGAQFHPDLHLPAGTTIISKATGPEQEAYSAFEATTLESRLKESGADTLYLAGLATDYCIKQTALDALKRGLRVVVLEDAICGIDATPGDCKRAILAMRHAGAIFAKAQDLKL